MGQEQTPSLVKPGGERVPVGGSISREELYEAIKLIVGNQASAEEIATRVAAEVAAQAVQGALNKVDKPEERRGEWNIHRFPHQSAFNPQGENVLTGGIPRADVVGDVWWNGQYLRKEDHTVEECALINQLRSGVFHSGQWLVKDLAPGVPGTRKLLVMFPCKDPDQRSSLPSMVAMLRELTGHTATPAASAA
jgi:hypothetical protein